MDSNNNHNSGSGCHFPPTSPHFFDLSSFHLDSLSFAHLLSSPPPARRDPPPEGINAAPPHLGPTRPSKKRSRASRRVPTTVLTTDTSNFRAMVQEFTGIPAPPFSTSATSPYFPRSLNLIPNPPSVLLKPFPNKFQSTTPPPATEFNNRGNQNSTPINFQSLLRSQLVNLQQPAAHVLNSNPNPNPNSGGLDLPGVIIGPAGEKRPISSTSDKRHESGEGLMESWICSSD